MTIIAIFCSFFAIFGSTACEPDTSPPANARVLVLGDSLSVEAKGSGEAFRLNPYRMDWSGAVFGTAPCNGIAKLPAINYTPDVVVVYSGNNGSMVGNCMNSENGAALAARYTADVNTIINHFDNGTTRIVIVGAPVRMDRKADTDGVFDAMQALAANRGVAFYDGGQNISPNRIYKNPAFCNPFETTCGTAGAGKNIIRSADRVHFCPEGGSLSGACASYNSGAVRYTEAIKAGIAVSAKPTN